MNSKRFIPLAIILGLCTSIGLSAQNYQYRQEKTLVQKIASISDETLFCSVLNTFPAYAAYAVLNGTEFSAQLIIDAAGVTGTALVSAFIAKRMAQTIA